MRYKAEDVSQGEIHGLRVENNKLEYYTGTEWKIASGGIPVGNVSGLSVKENDAEITLMWADPEDRYLDDLKIAEWQGTKIVRKEGSYPVSDDDGVLVVDNKIRNQYSNNGYKDTGLTNGVTYYYMAFPYTEDAITVDGANRIAGTPTEADDPSGSPGPKNLIAGTMEEGFFGVVPMSKLITGDELASKIGLSAGTSQFSSTAGWLKFAYKGNIQFVAKKPLRRSLSWDSINSANAIYGDKVIEIGGLKYKVRLMRGANKDPAGGCQGSINHGSEWNRLMLPIHVEAKDKSWAYSGNVESDIPYWGIDFTDEDLLTYYDHGNDSFSWCQEVAENPSYRVLRGNFGVSGSGSGISYGRYGWRPVLELVN